MDLDWNSLSEECLSKARAQIASCRSVLGGFNLVVDNVKQLGSGDLEGIAASCMTDQQFSNIVSGIAGGGPKAVGGSHAIDQYQHFIKSLTDCVRSGDSIEIPISDENIFKWLNEQWGRSSAKQAGGQPAFMAMAVCKLDPHIVLAGWPIPEAFVNSMPQAENLFLLVPQDQEIEVRPFSKCVELKEAVLFFNWVIEFSKGLTVSDGQSEVDCPRAGRFIAGWLPRGQWLKQITSDNICNSGIEVTHAFLSGCQVICPESDNEALWEQQVSKFASLVQAVKECLGCRFIHYEMASIPSPVLRQSVLGKVLTAVGSVGCNEKELVDMVETLGKKEMASRMRNRLEDRQLSISDVFQGASVVMQSCGLERIHVHTWDFHVSIRENGPSPPIKERDALLFGAVMGAAKTFATREIQEQHITQGLEKVPFSNKGIEMVKQVHRNPGILGTYVVEGVFQKGNLTICVIPGRVKANINSTVGLGDTLSSIAFLSATGACEEQFQTV